MKYTIELTNKQKAQMDCIIDIVHRYVGFNPKLEMDIPLPMKESPAYKKGFENGKKQAIEEIPELADKENKIYNDGYNKGLEDAWKLIVAIETDREVEEEVFGEDLDYNFDNVSVQDAMKKWKAYEEKKKADEVENYHILVDTLRTVTEEYPKETIVSALSEFGFEVDKLRGEEDEKN